jgi:preprotein translocase SecE subunit
MSSKKTAISGKKNWLDFIKWAVIFVAFFSAIGVDFYFEKVSFIVKSVIWISAVSLIVVLAWSTSFGKVAVVKFNAALVELKKVTWPDVDDVRKSTLMVGVCILFVAVLLWGMDAFFAAVVRWLSI